MAGGYLRFDIPYLSKLPIKSINASNKKELNAHNQIVTYVEQLIQINKEIQTATLESKIDQLKIKIEYNEDKINELVYQLYDLTKEEIELIENNHLD